MYAGFAIRPNRTLPEVRSGLGMRFRVEVGSSGMTGQPLAIRGELRGGEVEIACKVAAQHLNVKHSRSGP